MFTITDLWCRCAHRFEDHVPVACTAVYETRQADHPAFAEEVWVACACRRYDPVPDVGRRGSS